ncbi:hypothetical protein BDZ90DRAFT_251920 [Jaminaea rosea]|uniref:PCI domain-containing protein n=1 Tax=Jaminaea rosea TaxID=1569628 RepID=A0A316UYJ7_9BASI|nr:hypothetical protein BDZ90DRAFT_251920 [Jaminaea rosea]PWN28215.1 hypothetical protein BDZ90DRAFT_251920 [Jaminaea rosea]
MQILLDLRQLALLADRVTAASEPSTSTSRPAQPHLESTARHLNKAFTACVADRNPSLLTSRKWATYRIVAILFRTYFRLRALPLCRNVLRALSAAPLPPLDHFPRADRVTFRYYTGLLHFLAQDYAPALQDLSEAWGECHAGAIKQQELILVPLIPLELLLRGRRPSKVLLARFPKLEALYSPFLSSLAPKPDLRRFAAALAEPSFERALVVRGTYLAVEAFRPILLRQVVRRLCAQVLKSTRVKLADVQTALSEIEAGDAAAEVEWLVGSLIARGFVKGYLSHERQMMVLSNVNAFPPLKDVAAAGSGGVVGI